MNNPVGWFEIYVDDIERAKAFYAAVFGVAFTKLESPLAAELWAFPMVREGTGATGALVKMDGVETGHNSVIVYFVCADCAAECDKAVAAGGKVQKAKVSIGPYGFIAMVTDTEGNVIGLHSMR